MSGVMEKPDALKEIQQRMNAVRDRLSEEECVTSNNVWSAIADIAIAVSSLAEQKGKSNG